MNSPAEGQGLSDRNMGTENTTRCSRLGHEKKNFLSFRFVLLANIIHYTSLLFYFEIICFVWLIIRVKSMGPKSK